MEIAQRLKLYIDRHRIPVTQFADKCGIPRPTLSQLLSGRNKKVSDEVVTKIHEGYPDLSIMWLMFGEGSMDGGLPSSVAPAPVVSAVPSPMSEEPTLTEHSARENRQQTGSAPIAPNEPPRIDFGDDYTKPPKGTPYPPDPREEKPTDIAAEHKIAFIATSPDDLRRGKRVVSIVVYYDDNSYEPFVPDTSGRNPFK